MPLFLWDIPVPLWCSVSHFHSSVRYASSPCITKVARFKSVLSFGGFAALLVGFTSAWSQGHVCGLYKDFMSALEGICLPQLRGRAMVNWGYTALVTIVIDVDSSLLVFLLFLEKEKKEKFLWGRPNRLTLYDTG